MRMVEKTSFLGRLFARKKGGTAAGRLWRNIANRASGGTLAAVGLVNLTRETINQDMQENE